jgi:prepilin-type N-terminal cleavage/methylation domain-containing protein
MRGEDGFTLVELIVVVAVMGILLLVAMGFQSGARERAGDATAQANLRIAVPAIVAYHGDHGTYAGMTLAGLRTAYSPGVQGIEVVAADDAGYCLRAVAAGRTWHLAGPAGDFTQTSCA